MNPNDFYGVFLRLTNFMRQGDTPTPLKTPVQVISHFELLGFNPKVLKMCLIF